MNITVTIDPAAETVGLQAIAKALNLTDVTDAEVATALALRWRTEMARLYVQGDKIIREAAESATAEGAAEAYITTAIS